MRVCDETNGSLFFFKSNQGLPLRWSVSSKSFFPHLTCLRQNLRTQWMGRRKRTGIEDFSENSGHCSNGSGITGSCWADTSFITHDPPNHFSGEDASPCKFLSKATNVFSLDRLNSSKRGINSKVTTAQLSVPSETCGSVSSNPSAIPP